MIYWIKDIFIGLHFCRRRGHDLYWSNIFLKPFLKNQLFLSDPLMDNSKNSLRA